MSFTRLISLVALFVGLCAVGSSQVRIPGPGGETLATIPIPGPTATVTCSSPTMSCAVTTVTIDNTGDTAQAWIGYCVAVGCNSTTDGTFAVSGCGGTWTYNANASTLTARTIIRAWSAPNLTAGTCTVTFSNTVNMYYGSPLVADVQYANTSTPIDSSVSKATSTTGTAFSVTSTGNVTNLGELGLAFGVCAGGSSWTNSGGYTTLTSTTGEQIGLYKSNLSSGAGTTAAATCGSGTTGWSGSLVAITH